MLFRARGTLQVVFIGFRVTLLVLHAIRPEGLTLQLAQGRKVEVLEGLAAKSATLT